MILKIYSRLAIVLFLVTSCASKKAKYEDYVFKTKNEEVNYQAAYNKALKLWNIPYTEEDVKTSFGTAHIVIAGPKNGKDLVLLHGMDASSTMWYPNIKALAKNHRVYAIDYLMEPNKSVFEKSSIFTGISPSSELSSTSIVTCSSNSYSKTS